MKILFYFLVKDEFNVWEDTGDGVIYHWFPVLELKKYLVKYNLFYWCFYHKDEHGKYFKTEGNMTFEEWMKEHSKACKDLTTFIHINKKQSK